MNKKLFRAAAFLTAGVLWAGAAGVSCAADKMQTPVSPAKQGEKIEIQMEYLDGRYFKERDIDLYDLHLYRQYCKVHHVSLHYGLTVERAVGATTEQGIRRDSQAVGLGPSYMIRWEKDWSSKWSGSIDGTGSILAYNHAHPAGGRAFGFLWRIGPRLTYHCNESDSVSLAYLFHHSSNGFNSHNPGYNGVGFSLGFAHRF